MAQLKRIDPTVVIVEDEWAVAKDLQQSLQRAGFSVLGLAGSGSEALEQIERHNPSLVIMDIGLSGDLDGVQVAARIASGRDIPIVYVTGHGDAETLDRVASTNVMGYVLKPFNDRQLHCVATLAIRKAAARSRLARDSQRSQAMEAGLQNIATVLREIGVEPTASWQSDPDVATLTRRERDIMTRLVNNARVPTIAQAVSLSPHTVRNHLKNIYRKLDVHSQSELIEWARRRG